MDHSSAVLDELYGSRHLPELDKLRLAKRRVHSNIRDRQFLDGLDYIPVESGFSTDPSLLALLVAPLYREDPSIGVRELMQNAIDAVRELEDLIARKGIDRAGLDFPSQEASVLVEFTEQEKDQWVLRVTDKGVGMTKDVLQHYFLRAGASLRSSPEWSEEFIEDGGKSTVMRSGRFGVGIFAAFLLGDDVLVQTRHYTSATGYRVKANRESTLVPIRRISGVPVGTSVWVTLHKGKGEFGTDWHCLCWPQVDRRVIRRDGSVQVIEAMHQSPLTHSCPSSREWRRLPPTEVGPVFWRYAKAPALSCNGIRIGRMEGSGDWGSRFIEPVDDVWRDQPFHLPGVAVFDAAAKLPLTLTRTELTCKQLPFDRRLLLDVVDDFIAYCVVCAPTRPVWEQAALATQPTYPLLRHNGREFRPDLRWSSSATHAFPFDPWVLKSVASQRAIVFGCFGPRIRPPSGGWSTWGPKINDPDGTIAFRCDFARGIGDQDIYALMGGIQGPTGAPTKHFGNAWVASGITLNVAKCSIPDLKAYNRASGNRRMWTDVSYDSGFETLSYGSPKTRVDLPPGWADIPSDDGHPYFAIVEIEEWLDPRPLSEFAKAWKHYFGQTLIPFDPAERSEMLEKARSFDSLRHHIEAWEETLREAKNDS